MEEIKKDTLVIDTSIIHADTIKINLTQNQEFTLSKDPIEVITPGKDWFDYTLGWVTIVAAIITVWFTIASIRKLFKKDEDKQAQIDELKNQTKQLSEHNKLYEKRIRMINKPRIWSNGGSTEGYDETWSIRIDNKGEEAHIAKIEIIGGDINNAMISRNYTFPVELIKGGSTTFKGRALNKHPNDIKIDIKVTYEDTEGYKYETIFEWDGGKTKKLKTNEL